MRSELITEIDNLISVLEVRKGGAGSGNFGHAGRPGEVGGSGEGGSSKETQNSLLTKQKEQGKEQGAVLDKSGNVLVSHGGGTETSVHLTSDDMYAIHSNEATTWVHTHPSNNSFSGQDVAVDVGYGIENAQVITDKFIYTLKCNNTRGQSIARALSSEHDSLTESLMPSWIDKTFNGMSQADAEAGLTDEVNQKIASKYGLTYSKESR